jgi:hypothetical protein
MRTLRHCACALACVFVGQALGKRGKAPVTTCLFTGKPHLAAERFGI